MADPAATDPETADPTAADPGATELDATGPAATDPETADPTAADPGATEPAATDPGPTAPAATDPETADPAAGLDPTADTLSVDEAARRLGVKRQTVYAYTSRGLLERHPSSGRRGTRFARAAVEALAGRARRTDRSVAVEVVVETEITALDPAGRLAYRGRDAGQLARHAGFERTAALLWDAPGGTTGPWRAEDAAVRAVAAAVAPVAAEADPATLLPVVVSVLRAADAFRGDRRPAAVARAARGMVAAFVDGLPARGRPVDERVAARLWCVLAPDARAPTPAQVGALDAALVLLADHELAASAFAARVAASAWADPYAVVLAGLGPLAGPLHGTAGTEVEGLLRAARDPTDGGRVVAGWLAGPEPAGFGHRVYRDRDPRFDHLLPLVRSCARDPEAAVAFERVVARAADRGLPAPNVDLALAGLMTAMGLRAGSAAAVFAVARVAGLIAHALEEYPHRLRFRPRATYVGEARRAD